jgi:hypothetical protein
VYIIKHFDLLRTNTQKNFRMIIIKIKETRDESINITIASMLFNMELGCKVFSPNGEIDEPDEDFHVIEKNGISYTIQGVIGNIVVLYNGDNHRYTDFLSWDLEKTLQTLDNIYINTRVEGIPQYTGKSLDYTLVSELHNTTDDRRNIIHNINKYSSQNSHFVWVMTLDGKKILRTHSKNKASNRNTNEYRHLVQHNTLVIDTINVFESKENITFINGMPSKSDYSMSKKFVSYDVFTYSKKYGGIDYNLRHVGKSKSIGKKYLYLNEKIEPLFIPIYDEKWENINPMRSDDWDTDDGHVNAHDIGSHIFDLLTSSYNYMLMELEEVKNVESGAPPRPSDICHSCDMYLYDMIYVLELKNNHVCVCAKCFHYLVHPMMFDSFNCADIRVLKVRYPKTVVDLIGIIDMPEEVRSLMIELSGDVIIKDEVITTPNYVGYTDIDNILLKTVTPPEDKRLFVCKILS